MRQVVASGRFSSTRAEANDFTVRQHDGECENSVAHRAVTNGGASGGSRCGHATERAVGTGVNWEIEVRSRLGKMLIELQSCDTGLHRGVHVVGADSQNAIHASEVHADSAVNRDDSPFDGSAGTERDDRHTMPVTQPRDGGDFVIRKREHHAVWPLRFVMRDIFRMPVEIVGELRTAVAEQSLKLFHDVVPLIGTGETSGCAQGSGCVEHVKLCGLANLVGKILLPNLTFLLQLWETLPTVAVVRCENRCSPRDRENREFFAHEIIQRNLRYCDKPENQTDRDHAPMTLSDAKAPLAWRRDSQL